MGQKHLAPYEYEGEPPLIEEQITKTDPVTGLQVKGTRYRRGIRVNETMNYDLSNLIAFHPSEPKVDRFEELRTHLRDQLEELGLPSDRTPLWVCDPGGDWRPCNDDDDLTRIVPGRRLTKWRRRVEDLTRPLSRARDAARLLEALNDLLRRPGIQDHLHFIGTFAENYRWYQFSGVVSSLAASGATGERGRRKGPATLKQRTAETRSIICEHTQRLWDRLPKYKGDASNSAAVIRDEVNASLRERKLLPGSRDGLSAKTIGDHIRAAMRSGDFQTG